MLQKIALLFSLALAFSLTRAGWCADQTRLGEGNATAIAIASKSPMVKSAFELLKTEARKIRNAHARAATLDAIANPDTCIAHRAGLDAAGKASIVHQLVDAGLLDESEDRDFPGGLVAGVFPPVRDDGSKCPHLPQRFESAPGSSFGSHHSYPGGLAMHEAFNETTGVSIADDYRRFYGHHDANGIPSIAPASVGASDVAIDEDLIIAPPMWHDWAKTIVFQWNADGTEFQELPIGGNGRTDDNKGGGNSKTGAHHIIGLAEAMARAMPPQFVITEACAHAAPVMGAEYKVVNWIRAAATIARVDPVARGYLRLDATKHLRLAALRHTGDINAEDSAPDLLAEHAIHNLSDANFTIAMPAIASVNSSLRAIAPKFGYSADDVATFNNSFRNPVMSAMSAERLFLIITNDGLPGLEREVNALVHAGLVQSRVPGK
ncbi:MAG TPA: hypothetical protein VMT64_05250 [Candidatus Binataceae bacterium]|nr:hypothetical protein [Candidatus Binataceae bacterium]